jgi:hypothetical protein
MRLSLCRQMSRNWRSQPQGSEFSTAIQILATMRNIRSNTFAVEPSLQNQNAESLPKKLIPSGQLPSS